MIMCLCNIYMKMIVYYHRNGEDAYDDGDEGNDGDDDDVRAVGGVRKRCLALLMR